MPLNCPLCDSPAIATRKYRANNGADDVVLGCSRPKCLLYKLVNDFYACHSSKGVMSALLRKWNRRPVCTPTTTERNLLHAVEEALTLIDNFSTKTGPTQKALSKALRDYKKERRFK